MSTTDESPAAVATGGIADPAPLGLAGFALTTFLLSAMNFKFSWVTSTGGGGSWIGYAFAYGGLCQLLAGMWEFRRNNVFGATAFSTYGGFWIGLFFFVHFVVPGLTGPEVWKNEGWILLAFAIFNTYMLIISTQVNMAVFLVFLTLEITEILLFIGFFTTKTGHGGLISAGGLVGIITAIVAWYTSAAGAMNGVKGKVLFPVGKPLFDL